MQVFPYMDPMGYIVYNRLLRIIIVMYFPAIYHRRHFSSCRSRSLPQKFSSPITTTLPKAPAKLIFINPNLQFFKKSSKLQKQNMQFTMFCSLLRCFFPNNNHNNPYKTIFWKKRWNPVAGDVFSFGCRCQGICRIFFRKLGHRQYLEDRSPLSKWISG